MRYESTMNYLGYPVRLQDGTLNPTAVEADRILCARPSPPESIMLGVVIAESWSEAERNQERRGLEELPNGELRDHAEELSNAQLLRED